MDNPLTGTHEFEMRCSQGHTWVASMTFEPGGWRYDNPRKASCPVCKELCTVAEVYLDKEPLKSIKR